MKSSEILGKLTKARENLAQVSTFLESSSLPCNILADLRAAYDFIDRAIEDYPVNKFAVLLAIASLSILESIIESGFIPECEAVKVMACRDIIVELKLGIIGDVK